MSAPRASHSLTWWLLLGWWWVSLLWLCRVALWVGLLPLGIFTTAKHGQRKKRRREDAWRDEQREQWAREQQRGQR